MPVCLFPDYPHIEEFPEKSVHETDINRWLSVSNSLCHFCGHIGLVICVWLNCVWKRCASKLCQFLVLSRTLTRNSTFLFEMSNWMFAIYPWPPLSNFSFLVELIVISLSRVTRKKHQFATISGTHSHTNKCSQNISFIITVRTIIIEREKSILFYSAVITLIGFWFHFNLIFICLFDSASIGCDSLCFLLFASFCLFWIVCDYAHRRR